MDEEKLQVLTNIHCRVKQREEKQNAVLVWTWRQ